MYDVYCYTNMMDQQKDRWIGSNTWPDGRTYGKQNKFKLHNSHQICSQHAQTNYWFRPTKNRVHWIKCLPQSWALQVSLFWKQVGDPVRTQNLDENRLNQLIHTLTNKDAMSNNKNAGHPLKMSMFALMTIVQQYESLPHGCVRKRTIGKKGSILQLHELRLACELCNLSLGRAQSN